MAHYDAGCGVTISAVTLFSDYSSPLFKTKRAKKESETSVARYVIKTTKKYN
jgi:hypothetical protein